MKKFALVLTLVFCMSPIFVLADNLPQIAVYVTGEIPENEKRGLGTTMLSHLVNSGHYAGEERNVFFDQAVREYETQGGGVIDDNQISALGRQFGIRYVCVTDISPEFWGFQLSARIIDAETAEIVFTGEAFANNLNSARNMRQVSNELVNNMFRGRATVPQHSKAKEERSGFITFKTRIGGRVAPNIAIADVVVYSNTLADNYAEKNDNLGYGFEFGFVANTEVFYRWCHWSLNYGLTIVPVRTPVNTTFYKANEAAIIVPILFRLRHESIFVYSGFQSERVFSDIPNRNVFYNRNLVFGAGYAINRNMELDIRYVRTLSEFLDVPAQQGAHLTQISTGFTYMFGN